MTIYSYLSKMKNLKVKRAPVKRVKNKKNGLKEMCKLETDQERFIH